MANIQCARCREQKKRCIRDGDGPCSNCKKAREECHYQSRYEIALDRLDQDNRGWMDNAIPDRLAEAFAKANHLFCIADYHRPLRAEDANWFKTKSNPTFQMAFVMEEDKGRTSILGKAAPAFIGCHDRPGDWVEMGRVVTYENDLSTETRWKEHCEKHCLQTGCDANDPTHIVLLLSFEGINEVLIKSVKEMGGFVIVVEDADKIHPDNFDLRINSERLPHIFGALTNLRSVYQTPLSTPIADVRIDHWKEYPDDKRLMDAWLDTQGYSETTRAFHLGRVGLFCAFAQGRRRSLADIIAMADENMSSLVKEYAANPDTEQRLLMALRGVRDHAISAATQE